jgi:hypothetical protein
MSNAEKLGVTTCYWMGERWNLEKRDVRGVSLPPCSEIPFAVLPVRSRASVLGPRALAEFEFRAMCVAICSRVSWRRARLLRRAVMAAPMAELGHLRSDSPMSEERSDIRRLSGVECEVVVLATASRPGDPMMVESHGGQWLLCGACLSGWAPFRSPFPRVQTHGGPRSSRLRESPP